MAARIRKNDSVMIMAGKDRGKVGKVIRVHPSEGRAVVERLNMVKSEDCLHTRRIHR